MSIVKYNDLPKGEFQADIDILIKEHIREINNLIRIANNEGKKRVEYELPKMVEIRNVSNYHAQITLFYRLALEIEKANYDIKFLPADSKDENDSSYFIISWNKYKTEEYNEMMAYLKSKI